MITIGLSLVIAGCGSSVNRENSSITTPQVVNENQSSSTLVPEPTNTVELVAQLSSPTPDISATIALTATPTETLVPTGTATAAPSPTNTKTPPLPTLSPEEAVHQVMALLEDNQNPECLLPCWWGATPGITYWREIEPFLSTFSTTSLREKSRVWIELPLSETVSESSRYTQLYAWDESGKIETIAIQSINIAGYDAKTMMTQYGVPDEVWLTTLSEPREGVLPFHLIIVYQQQGISFRYYVEATRNGENVTACFKPGVIELKRPHLFPASPEMYLWESGKVKSIEEIVREPLLTIFPLQDKTDLTPETLHTRFTNPDEQPYIDTPADLW